MKKLAFLSLFSFATFAHAQIRLLPMDYNFEIGQSMGLFLDRPVQIHSEDLAVIVPSFAKVSVTTPCNMVLGLNFKYNTYSYEEKTTRGSGYFYSFDLSVGKAIKLSEKFRLDPFIAISDRISAWENAGSSGFDGLGSGFRALKYGIGGGFSANYLIKKHFTVGMETQYNCYLGNANVDMSRYGFDNYKRNRHVLNFALKFGYQLHK